MVVSLCGEGNIDSAIYYTKRQLVVIIYLYEDFGL